MLHIKKYIVIIIPLYKFMSIEESSGKESTNTFIEFILFYTNFLCPISCVFVLPSGFIPLLEYNFIHNPLLCVLIFNILHLYVI